MDEKAFQELNQTLASIWGADPAGLIKDVRKVNALLMDLLPKREKERRLIVSVLREGIGPDLLAVRGQPSTAQQPVLDRWVRRLVSDIWISGEAARFAVNVLAASLGLQARAANAGAAEPEPQTGTSPGAGSCPGFRAIHAAAQGEAGRRIDSEPTDVSDSWEDADSQIIAVCTAADDAVRGPSGAVLACKAAMELLRDFIRHTDAQLIERRGDTELVYLESRLYSDWSERIRQFDRQNPLTPVELARMSAADRRMYQGGAVECAYGCSLLAAAVTDGYWVALQIGGGRCVAVTPDGTFEQPLWEESDVLWAAEASLGGADALSGFRHAYALQPPAAVLLCSEGVDLAFRDTEQLYSFYRSMLGAFARDGFDKAAGLYQSCLPQLSDLDGGDVAMAAVIDPSQVTACAAPLAAQDAASDIKEAAKQAASQIWHKGRRLAKEKLIGEDGLLRKVGQQLNESHAAERASAAAARLFENAWNRAQSGGKTGKPSGGKAFCEECGKPLSPGKKFCGYCGAPVDPPEG